MNDQVPRAIEMQTPPAGKKGLSFYRSIYSIAVFPINIGKTFSFLFVADRIDFIVNEMRKIVNHRIRL